MTKQEWNKTITEEQIQEQNFTEFCYVMARLIAKYIDKAIIPEPFLEKAEAEKRANEDRKAG